MNNAKRINELTKKIDMYNKELRIINDRIDSSFDGVFMSSAFVSASIYMVNAPYIIEPILGSPEVELDYYLRAAGIIGLTGGLIVAPLVFGSVKLMKRVMEKRYTSKMDSIGREIENLESELASLGYVYKSGLYEEETRILEKVV